MAKKIPTRDEKNASILNNIPISTDIHLILDQIKMTSFIQMCNILEKDNPNDEEFGNKIRVCIKTFTKNNKNS